MVETLYFLKAMNNAAFGKTMKNARKYRDNKLVTTDKRRNQLASEPNYNTTKHFSENLLAIEMIKTKLKMNKPIYLGMSILNISKTLIPAGMRCLWEISIRSPLKVTSQRPLRNISK